MDYTAMEQYWIWLSSVEGIGPKRFYQLLSLYEDARSVWDALGGVLTPPDMKVLGPQTLEKLRAAGIKDLMVCDAPGNRRTIPADARLVEDLQPDKGPLCAIASALNASGAEYCVILSVDAAAVSADTVGKLMRTAEESSAEGLQREDKLFNDELLEFLNEVVAVVGEDLEFDRLCEIETEDTHETLCINNIAA